MSAVCALYIDICMYVYMCMYIHVCVYIYILTYMCIHTYTRALLLEKQVKSTSDLPSCRQPGPNGATRVT